MSETEGRIGRTDIAEDVHVMRITCRGVFNRVRRRILPRRLVRCAVRRCPDDPGRARREADSWLTPGEGIAHVLLPVERTRGRRVLPHPGARGQGATSPARSPRGKRRSPLHPMRSPRASMPPTCTRALRRTMCAPPNCSGASRVTAKSPDETRRYVSQRLIDLYLGPLTDEGRALVELRKLADGWPGTREGDGAERAIARSRDSERYVPMWNAGGLSAEQVEFGVVVRDGLYEELTRPRADVVQSTASAESSSAGARAKVVHRRQVRQPRLDALHVEARGELARDTLDRWRARAAARSAPRPRAACRGRGRRAIQLSTERM